MNQIHPATDPANLSVLVVDDEPMLRTVIQDFLNMLGFVNQWEAGDGLEALDVLRSRSVDCMISDIRMPNMELEELLRTIGKEFTDLIVIATSGYSDFENAAKIFKLGAHDFLGKPLNLDALEMAITWVIERRTLMSEVGELLHENPGDASLDRSDRIFDALEEMLLARCIQFRQLIEHAVRVGRLCRQLKLDLPQSALFDLISAAYLHEIGASYQMNVLCSEPRQLEAAELNLIRAHAPIAGRMVSAAVGRESFLKTIGSHMNWQDASSNSTDPLCGSAWLGLLNSVDGWLQARPDRPPATTEYLCKWLTQWQETHPSLQLQSLLDQWSTVESLYRSRV